MSDHEDDKSVPTIEYNKHIKECEFCQMINTLKLRHAYETLKRENPDALKIRKQT
jgi:hypothetical protein